MTPRQQAAAKAAALLATRSIEQLMFDWEATETNNAPEIPMARGWLMEEMERRNPAAFEAWLEGDATLAPRVYFLP